MSDAPTCETCCQEMYLDKDFGVRSRGARKLRYRVKRYGCDLCETFITIFADGEKDKVIPELLAKGIMKDEHNKNFSV